MSQNPDMGMAFADQDRQRLSSLEHEVGELKTSVTAIDATMRSELPQLRNQLSNIAQMMTGSEERFNNMLQKTNDSRKVNWGWIFAGLMVIVSIGALHTTSTIQPLVQSIEDHKEISYHAGVPEYVQAEIRDMQDVLRREIDQTSETTNLRISTGHEIRDLKLTVVDEKLSILKQDISDLKSLLSTLKEQHVDSETVVELNARIRNSEIAFAALQERFAVFQALNTRETTNQSQRF